MKRSIVFVLALALTMGLMTTADAAPRKYKVSISTSASTITQGASLTIAGRVKPARAGKKVRIQRKTKDKWVTVAKVKIAKNRTYKYQPKPGIGLAQYRAYIPKSRKYRAGYSRAVSVRVLAIRITSTGPTGIDIGQRFLVSGRTSTDLRGKIVRLQLMSGSQWSSITSVTVSRSGAFTLSGMATKIGRDQKLRVDAPATSKTKATASAVLKFSVYADPKTRTYLFEDNFNGQALDKAKWGTRHQPPANRRKCAQPSQNMVTVANGTARLKVRMRPNSRSAKCPHGVWDNAMIGTLNGTDRFASRYGVFAARVRFQPGRGMHGGFWAQGPPVTGAEIDIAEYFGDRRSDGGLASYVHYIDAHGKSHSSGGLRNVQRISSKGRTPSNTWHIYSVEWNPSGYIFRIDGYPTLVTSKPHVATSSESMILSLLTSDWELPAMKDPSSTMYVDWVRAWK